MAAPNSVFWVDEVLKVFERKMPDTSREDGSFEAYRMFIREMHAYLKGIKTSVESHQKRLDGQQECYVCGNHRTDNLNGNTTHSVTDVKL